jgi:hypothetical protein
MAYQERKQPLTLTGHLMRPVLIAAMCLALIGCQVSTAPTSVAQLDQRHALSATRTQWIGQYTLYRLPATPKEPRTVVHTLHLGKNERLGFIQRESGVVAVAGDLEIPLATGSYEWVMQADSGQVNGWATAGLVVLITGVVVGILLAVLVITADQGLSNPNNYHRRH